MYFAAELKVENSIYLFESFSKSLISIHIPSGNVKIETYLPWNLTEAEIHMLSWKHNIVIGSPIADYILIYDCRSRQVKRVKLQGIEIDDVGMYYSNILVDQDDFIILPFKGKEIRRYGINGDLKSKDDKWCLSFINKYGYETSLFKNIRTKSACFVDGQIFFSLVYGHKDFLCRYILNKESSFSIVYNSEDIFIKGVYGYTNVVLFRRVFSDKTEIILFFLDSNKQERIIINVPAYFEGDIFGDLYYITGSFKNGIFKIERNDLKQYKVIYDFKQSDIYIANGVIFNTSNNEITVLYGNNIKKYLLEEAITEIKNSKIYYETYKKIFAGKCIMEGKYKIRNLTEYITKIPDIVLYKNENKNCGELIWNIIKK